jgi:hypothetical protein
MPNALALLQLKMGKPRRRLDAMDMETACLMLRQILLPANATRVMVSWVRVVRRSAKEVRMIKAMRTLCALDTANANWMMTVSQCASVTHYTLGRRVV